MRLHSYVLHLVLALSLVRCGSSGSTPALQSSSVRIPTDARSLAAVADAPAVASAGGFYLGGSGYSDSLASAFAVQLKLREDGSVDSSFGNRGERFLPLPGGVTLDQVGDFAASGQGDLAFAVTLVQGASRPGAILKYHSDGSLATEFGSAGIVPIACDMSSRVHLRLQSDGKVLMSCNMTDAGQSFGILRRYALDGSLDPSFDPLDLLRTKIGLVQDMQPASDGGILLLASPAVLVKVDTFGNVVNGFPASTSGLVPGARLVVTRDSLWITNKQDSFDSGWNLTGLSGLLTMTDTFGSLSGSFGKNGVSQFTVGGGATPYLTDEPTVCERPDGKYYVLGSAFTAGTDVAPQGSSYFYIRSLSSDGSPDTTYGTGGTVLVPLTAFYSPYWQAGDCRSTAIVSFGWKGGDAQTSAGLPAAIQLASLSLNPSDPGLASSPLTAIPMGPR